MSAEDDRLVLTEYSEWRAARGPLNDTSTDTFLAERERGFNERRVADSLKILNTEIGRHQRVTDLTQDSAVDLLLVLGALRDILEGDRPFIEQSTLTGPTTRTYL